jgi:chaperone required for assembly of F1-ATPase
MSETSDGGQAARGPDALAAKPLMPRRLSKEVSLDETPSGWRVLLDGRVARTPRKRELTLPVRALAEAILAEWASQGERLNPGTMPLTKLANTTIDAVVGHEPVVRAEIAKYAGSDLLCYRADAPAGLAQRQAETWDPLLDWSTTVLGARLAVAEGLMPITQARDALDAVAKRLAPVDAFRLTSLHVVTSLTGSCLLALAHLDGRLDEEQAWSAAHIDEDWQIERWGEDVEASERRAKRRAEMAAACRLLALMS